VIRLFQRKRPPWSDVLSERDINQLATYNGERARGIVHTEAWVAEMAELQRRFDWAMRLGR